MSSSPDPRGQRVHLPPALRTLIGFNELGRADWWHRAQEQLLVGLLYLEDTAVSRNGLLEHASRVLAVNLDRETVKTLLSGLVAAGRVARVGNEYQLTDGERVTTAAMLAEEELAERELRERLDAAVRQRTDQAWPWLWDAVLEDLLIPLVQRLGPLIYDRLRQQLPVSAFAYDDKEINRLLQRFPQEHREAIRREIVHLSYDPQFDLLRRRLVSAYLAIQSAALDQRTLQYVTSKLSAPRSLRLLLDTNIVFSLLGLRDHPANDAIAQLVEVLNDTSVSVELEIHEWTLLEARAVLGRAQADSEGVLVGRTVAQAVLEVQSREAQPTDSLVLGFLTTAATSQRSLSASVYFENLIGALETLLRERNVAIADVPSPTENDRSEASTQGAELISFAQNAGRTKTADSARHDALVRTVVLRRRAGANPRTAFEIQDWLLTLDTQLLAYDARLLDTDVMEGRAPHGMPTCIHPYTLLSMLQLQRPRSARMEAALFANFRLPVVLRTAPDDEHRLALAVLRRCEDFESSGRYSARVIARLVYDDELKRRIRAGEAEARRLYGGRRRGPTDNEPSSDTHVSEEDLDAIVDVRAAELDKDLRIEHLTEINLELQSLISEATDKLAELERSNEDWQRRFDDVDRRHSVRVEAEFAGFALVLVVLDVLVGRWIRPSELQLLLVPLGAVQLEVLERFARHASKRVPKAGERWLLRQLLRPRKRFTALLDNAVAGVVVWLLSLLVLEQL